jgi:GPI ethanolamine phosphate transferase 1
LEHHIYRYVNATQPVNITESKTQSNGTVVTKAETANGVAVKAPSPSSANTTNILNPTTSATNSTTASQLTSQNYRTLTLSDFRTSLFSLYLLQSAFFSTGNIASVSSFSLDAVYRLIPVFDPFSQGALLVFKILIPFALLSFTLGLLTRRLGVGEGALMMVLMGVGDYMTIRFFWMVKDEGSWLEIGSSISCFAIASALAAFLGAIEGVSGVMVGGVRFEDDENAVQAMENDRGVREKEKEGKSEELAQRNGEVGSGKKDTVR